MPTTASDRKLTFHARCEQLSLAANRWDYRVRPVGGGQTSPTFIGLVDG